MSRVSYPSNENPEKKNSEKMLKNFQIFFFPIFLKFFSIFPQPLLTVASNEQCAVGNGHVPFPRLPAPTVGTVVAARARTWHLQN